MANSKNNSAKNANSSFSPAVIVTICLAVAILAGVIVWSVFAKQANSLDNKVAMEVGETSVSGLEYQFYYKNEIVRFAKLGAKNDPVAKTPFKIFNKIRFSGVLFVCACVLLKVMQILP